jgi:hypothetical protein
MKEIKIPARIAKNSRIAPYAVCNTVYLEPAPGTACIGGIIGRTDIRPGNDIPGVFKIQHDAGFFGSVCIANQDIAMLRVCKTAIKKTT